ncbi:TRNA-specific 2-thiouridylase [Senna tora]|uniref:tRNA-specific 2-thiouridylase n=1 Tax=Senna tora TaxID=362788 RepID=A0A834SJZ9_9FABA|nr:TRNA-specific 2-thiouridylase [Senna tora]
MLHVGFGRRHRKCGYEKLKGGDQKVGRARMGWVNGRLRGLRLSRSTKITVKAFSGSRIVRMYRHLVRRMNMETIYPAIVVPTQWGLPHPSLH